MIDCVNDLVAKLSNDFTSLDETEKEYQTRNDKLIKYENLLDYINCDVKKMNKCDDQELIIDAVKDIDSTVKEYEAACYLVDSTEESVVNLPQYRNARIYLENLINYLKMIRDRLKEETQGLKDNCSKMHISKKYYEILQEDEPFIQDISEFIELLDRENVIDNERRKILSFVIKNNVKNYKKEN